MKRLFPGNFEPTKQDILKIWDDCTLILDSSVFLSLYSNPTEDAISLINVIHQYQDLIWIPYQAAKIYLDKRDHLIAEKASELKEFKESFDENIQLLTKRFARCKNPIIHDLSHDLEDFSPIIEHFEKSMDKRLKQYMEVTAKIIQDKLNDVLDEDSMGVPVPYQVLDNLQEEADRRESYHLPPFIHHEEVGLKMYQSLLQWIQIVSYVKNERKPALFITADHPNDWWESVGQNKFTSRPELINELNSELRVFFHIIDISTFLEVAKEVESREKSQAIEIGNKAVMAT